MITGIIIGVVLAIGTLIYVESRMAYLKRKVTPAIDAAHAAAKTATNVATAAKATAEAAKATIDAVKKA